VLAPRNRERHHAQIAPRRLTDADKRAVAVGAASLYELAAHPGTIPHHPDDDQAAEVEAVYRSWNAAFSPGNVSAFERRLEWDGLTPESARQAIAKGLVADPHAELPEWLTWLEDIATHAAAVAVELAHGTCAEIDSGIGQEHPFIELLVPMIRAGRHVLDGHLDSRGTSPIDAAAVQAFESQLARELSRVTELAFFAQFQEFAANRLAEPQSDASHTDDYTRWISEVLESGFVTLFLTYPVLARQVATVIEGWTQATGELLDRLDVDRPALAATFNGGKTLGALVAVDPALSDPHNGRRRVASLEFESGVRIVYKPRDVRLERAFSSFLEWLARQGLSPAQRVLRVLLRDGYGWVEMVVPGRLRDARDVRRHFEQCGGLIAVAYLLRGRDLHMENLIATSEGPVLIDLELMLEPELAVAHESSAADSGDPSCQTNESCLASGILSFIESSADGSLFDVGALRGTGEGIAALAQRRWKNLRTSAIHAVEERVFRTATHNRVEFEGHLQPPEPWTDAILDGFERTYRFLLENRPRVLAAAGPLAAFAGMPTRVIPRPTNQYGLLTYVLNQPKYQRRGVLRSAAMDALHRIFAASPTTPATWPIVRVERLALEEMDFPIFGVRSDETRVTARGDVVLDGYFSRSGCAAARRLFESFSEADLLAQRAELARVLSESTSVTFSSRLEPAPFDPDDPLNDSGEYVAHARWIADELLACARQDARGLVWDAADRALDGIGDLYLYDGSIGASLFLAAMFVVTREEKWRDASRASLAPLAALFDRPTSSWSQVPIGGTSGLGSITYALALAGALLDDSRYFEWARRCRRQLTRERIERDEGLDVVAGAAGALLALTASRHVLEDAEALDLAACCGDRLLTAAIRGPRGWKWSAVDGRRYVGFGHGAAGIGRALRRLGEATGEARFIQAADRAFEFVESEFSSGRSNWASADEETSGPGPSRSMIAWCHGAAGISLALAPEFQRTGQWADRLSTALHVTASAAAHQAEHLCCGNMGRAETLLTAGRICGRPEAVDGSRQILRHVMRRAASRGHFRLSASPFEYRVFDPGFFRGLSGIGYQFLRTAAPDRLPSVLSFEIIGRPAAAAR
jgi:class II lanthipeptide synthase